MSCNISIVIITALKTSNIAGKEKKTILTLQINFHIDFILILTLNFHNSAFWSARVVRNVRQKFCKI